MSHASFFLKMTPVSNLTGVNKRSALVAVNVSAIGKLAKLSRNGT